MEITVSVALDAGESFAGTPEWAAQNTLAALGGDPSNDHCVAWIGRAIPPPERGEAGTPPPPDA